MCSPLKQLNDNKCLEIPEGMHSIPAWLDPLLCHRNSDQCVEPNSTDWYSSGFHQ